MRANCWYGTKKVQVENVPDPSILNPRDAIVRITKTAICGSDLHLYNGFIPSMKRGDILGHEFMGEVVEIGSAVRNLQIGDRVVVPFPIACGHCAQCERDMFSLCETPTRTRGWRRSCTGTFRAGSSATRTWWAGTPAGRRNMCVSRSPTSARSRSPTA